MSDRRPVAFAWWRDLLHPVRLEDPDFGSMRFLRQSSTWECRTPFAPEGGDVEVLIESDRSGPSATQRRRWQELPARYANLRAEAESAIGRIVEPAGIEGFEFGLAAVVLPEDSASGPDLVLTFGDPTGPPQFDVEIGSWRLLGISGPL